MKISLKFDTFLHSSELKIADLNRKTEILTLFNGIIEHTFYKRGCKDRFLY
jgi:hypothetical protein